MQGRFLSVFLSALFLLTACNDRLVSPEEEVASGQQHESAVIEGQMIVQLSEDAVSRLEKGDDVFSGLGLTSVERLYPFDEEWENRHRAWGLHQWYVLDYDENIPSTKAAGDLAQIDGVLYVEQPRRVSSTSATSKFPDDPLFGKQWHYYNDGSLASNYTPGCDINVVPVWNSYTGGSSDVIVAIIDSGIDMSHEDLASVCIPAGSNGSKNFVDDSYSIVPGDHGTHVAGTVGAINGNGVGVSGVAGGLDGKGGVKLLSCEIFQYDPATKKDKTGNIAAAMIWAADHGAVIAQNSWGYVYDSAADAAAGSVGSMKTAIDYFVSNAGMDKNGKQVGPMAGGVVIFAAGNDGWPNGWPAAYGECIAVGAINGSFKRTSYSNYGSWVDICAPGGDSQDGHLVLSTVPGNEYGSMQGTSMACPHVSGVAALIVSYFGGPGFTNDMLKERLLGGARTGVISSSAKIGNLVDAYGSFTYGDSKAPDMVKSYDLSVSSNTITVDAVLPADDDGSKAWGLLFLASENREDLVNANPKQLSPSISYSRALSEDTKLGGILSGSITDLKFESSYYVAVMAYDYCGNYSAVSEIKTIKTLSNNAPEFVCDLTFPVSVKAHETLFFDVEVQDPDGHLITVDFSPGSEAASISGKKQDGTWQVTISGADADAGTYVAVLTATDAYGAKNVLNMEYVIEENHAPELVKEIDNLVFETLGAKMSIDMSEYLHDPDGETLKFSITISDKSILHINPKDNILNFTTLDYGKVKVEIVASDAKGLSCTLSFSVLVRNPDSPASIYPNPLVKNDDGKYILHVCGGTSADTYVKVVSSSGYKVFEGEGVSDAFDPFEVDMSNCSPGVYTVTARIGENETIKKIIKL